jgi:curved DNA-binding protein CbpA
MPRELPQRGNLRSLHLPAILTLIQKRRLSGTLTLKRNDQEKFIYVRDGEMIFAASQYPDDRLGEFLLKNGKIGVRAFEESTREVIRTGKRQGSVLVEKGFLSPRELVWGVSNQVQEIILSLFTWVDGEFLFEKDVFPTQEVITLKISTGDLILKGVNRINDWVRLRGELPELDSVPRRIEEPASLYQRVPLDEKQKKCFNLINGARSLFQIFDESPLPPFDTLKLVYFLTHTDAVGFSDTPAAREPAFTETKAAGPEAAKMPAGDEGGAAPENRDRINRAFENLGRKTHYEVLEIPASASPSAVKKAYFAMSKLFHPDRHYGEGMSEMKPKLETLFHRITEAYNTLMDQEKRKKYDFEVSADRVHGGRGKDESRTTVEETVSRGKLALKNGEIKTAVYFFEQAVDSRPDRASYHSLLADALSRIKTRRREAEAHYLEAIRIDPSAVDNYLSLGRLYEEAGLGRRALQQFEKALSWDPDNTSVKERIRILKSEKAR